MWTETRKIVEQRKNRNPNFCGGASTDEGVDLNRNFAVDFGQVDNILDYQEDSWLDTVRNKKKGIDPCLYNFPGLAAFSEPETQAFKNFLTSKKG